MDAAELIDDIERFETEMALADVARSIAGDVNDRPESPLTTEMVRVQFGKQSVDIGAVVSKKVSRDEFDPLEA